MIKDRCRKVILLLLACSIAFSTAGCGESSVYTVKSPTEGLTALEVSGESEIEVASNDRLKMTLNPTTTAVTITDKKNNAKWSTNPAQSEIDKIPSADGKNRMASQLTVTYHNPENKLQVMNNYDQSILKQQFEFYQIENGIKVVYHLGDFSRDFVPDAMTEARFNELILSKATDDQKKWLDMGFTYVVLSEVTSEKQRTEYLKKYPILEEENLYLRKTTQRASIQNKVKEAFITIGYTLDDFERDKDLIGGEVAEVEKIYFTVPIEYKLDGDDFVVSLPADEVYGSKSCQIADISLLEAFGANQSKNGYIFLPDGSGSLVNLNNGKNTTSVVPISVYSNDEAIFSREQVQVSENAPFPVYGMRADNMGYFAILEDGAAAADIYGNVARDFLPYNQAYTTYRFQRHNSLPMQGLKNTVIEIFEKTPYQGDYVTRYKFLYGEDSSYVGMANTYRNYLLEKGELNKKKDSDTVPLALELIGAIRKKELIAGVPVTTEIPLSKYEDAQALIGQLKQDGVAELSVKYNGCYEGGVRGKYPTKANLEGKLGSKSDFKNLLSYANEQSVDIYPNINIQYVDQAFQGMFKGFNTFSNGSKFIIREYAYINDLYAPLYLRLSMEGRMYLASPTEFMKQTTSYLKSASSLGVSNVSFETLGHKLNSDYNTNDRFTNRQNAVQKQCEVLETASQNGKVMIQSGNDYALKYADMILNMPLDSSRYYFTDVSVPFMQIVLHGYIDYAGEPINLSGDYKRNLLKSIECGAIPYYTLITGNNSEILNSSYSQYYTVSKDVWYNDMLTNYRTLNELLASTTNSKIVDHKIIETDVTMTEYEDGTKVYVNCTLRDVNTDGVKIGAENYAVVKGGR